MPSNDQRADWADHALTTFQADTGCDREDALQDLLTDLMHLANREGWDFDGAVMRAEGHYDQEMANPEPEDISAEAESVCGEKGADVRNLYLLDAYRRRDPAVIKHYGNAGDDKVGVFELPSPIDKATIRVIASSGDGWDHVSVSRQNRCPNWTEMEYVKRLFFRDDETAMQLHVPPTDHISVHPYCLHLWRPLDLQIPMPPKDMVA